MLELWSRTELIMDDVMEEMGIADWWDIFEVEDEYIERCLELGADRDELIEIIDEMCEDL